MHQIKFAERENMKPLHAKFSGWVLLVLAAGFLVPGCVHYEAKPLDAATSLEALTRRSLSEPGLRRFIEENGSVASGQWPPESWDYRLVTLAALHFSPELEVARAKLAEAEAARLTAGERPNPAIGLDPGYNTSTLSGLGISPWILGISFDVPLETAGKRGHRISEAGHLSDAAKLQLAETAWAVRSGVRQALVDLWAARKRVILAQQNLEATSALVRINEAQFEVGDIDRSELMVARLLAQQALIDSGAADGESDQARIRLALAAGLPPHALDDVTIDLAEFDAVPSEIPTADARREALLSRADILGALAAYAASESALRREVAGQYPDLSIGPGYEYDQGDNKWSIGFQLTLPLLNRNRGPIAEAEAKRTAAAAAFASLQSGVLGDIEAAAAAFQTDRRLLEAVDAMFEEARQQTEVVEKQYAAGAVSRKDELSSRLEEIAAASNRLDAQAKAQTSLGELEYALQTPLDSVTFPAAAAIMEEQ